MAGPGVGWEWEWEAACLGPGSRRGQAARMGKRQKVSRPTWFLHRQKADLCHEDSGGHDGFRQGLGVVVWMSGSDLNF